MQFLYHAEAKHKIVIKSTFKICLVSAGLPVIFLQKNVLESQKCIQDFHKHLKWRVLCIILLK